MPIGSVTSSTPSLSIFSAASSRAATEAAVAKLDRQADERAQLEFLGRQIYTLEKALLEIRENWRRSDDLIPSAAASAASGAVLDQAADASVRMADLAAFGAVGAGTLAVNGTDIAFDPDSDSLQDVVDRINAAGAGVTAAFDDDGTGIVLTSDDDTADMSLDDGGAGLLAALDVSAATYEPSSPGHTPGMSWSRAGTIAEALADAVGALNAIFGDELPGGEASSTVVRTRGDLQKAVEDFWKVDTTDMMRDVGFTQDFEKETGDPLSFTRRSERELVRALRGRPSTAEVMLFGAAGEGKGGLVGKLEIKTGLIRKRLDTTFERRGITINAYA
jgi:hypothetical protein